MNIQPHSPATPSDNRKWLLETAQAIYVAVAAANNRTTVLCNETLSTYLQFRTECTVPAADQEGCSDSERTSTPVRMVTKDNTASRLKKVQTDLKKLEQENRGLQADLRRAEKISDGLISKLTATKNNLQDAIQQKKILQKEVQALKKRVKDLENDNQRPELGDDQCPELDDDQHPEPDDDQCPVPDVSVDDRRPEPVEDDHDSTKSPHPTSKKRQREKSPKARSQKKAEGDSSRRKVILRFTPSSSSSSSDSSTQETTPPTPTPPLTIPLPQNQQKVYEEMAALLPGLKQILQESKKKKKSGKRKSKKRARVRVVSDGSGDTDS